MEEIPIYNKGQIVVYAYRDPTPLKRRYKLGQFLRVLTDDEYSQIETIATANTPVGKRAKRLLAIWRESGVDMNETLTYNG